MKKYGLILLLSMALFILAACTSTEKAPKNIADLAKDTANLSTLVSALSAADLVTTLEGDGPFTVFAPDNDAFAALLAAQGVADLDALIAKLGADTVKGILLYHVVSGTKAASTDLSDGQKIATAQGAEVTIGVSGANVTVNDANVSTADVEASNGIVHIIDKVILPPAEPESTSFPLTATGAGGTNVSGKATFEKVSDTETRVLVEVTGTPAGGVHPMHIHVGDVVPGGGIYITLTPVNGDTGLSETLITQNDAGDAVSYEDLLAYDGYINIHLSATEMATVVANGEVGLQEEFFTAALSGANEVPAVVTEGSGTVTLALNGNDFSLNGTYSGLTGPATMAHIHGPAEKTANAGVVVALTVTEGETAGSGSLFATGSFTDEQVANLKAGLFYINVHTAANAPGEIRGQLE